MVGPLVVPSEQVHTVVTAIGRADDRVDVVPAGLVVVEHEATLLVELDKYDRAMDAVVERFFADSTEP